MIEFYTSKGRFALTKEVSVEYVTIFDVSEIDINISSNIVDNTVLFISHGISKYKYKCYSEGFIGFDNSLDSFFSILQLYNISKDEISEYKLLVLD